MATDHEVEAMGKISDALSKVEDDAARARILSWARDKYLPKGSTPSRDGGPADSRSETLPGSVEGLGQRASRWIRQAGLTPEQIDQVFHLNGNEVSVIAATMPGQNAAERVASCYLLEGVRSLLATDEPAIVDSAARELCRSAGCYDPTNHSKRVAKFENRITGDAGRGWTVTGPGLSAAAALIKEIAGA